MSWKLISESNKYLLHLLLGVEFNAPPSTAVVISEADITANHMTDTDKQNSTLEALFSLCIILLQENAQTNQRPYSKKANNAKLLSKIVLICHAAIVLRATVSAFMPFCLVQVFACQLFLAYIVSLNERIIKDRDGENRPYMMKTTTLVQLPLTTFGLATKWAYSTTLVSPHGVTEEREGDRNEPILCSE